MAQDIAELGISVDSSGVEKAKVSLDELAQSGAQAEKSAKGVGEAWTGVGQKAGSAGAKVSDASNSFKAGNEEIRKQQQELGKLLGQIDPVVAALDRLDKQEKQLRGFKASGALDAETFQQFNNRIQQSRNALSVFDDSLTKTGTSAKQTQQALRQLPAQFSDIFVSLQAGQSPLTVFLQQGAQIKDSFGGIGPALRETGKAALGLINPYTAAAAAALAIAVAYQQGSEEAVAFNKALILTGNAAGTTAEALANTAVAIDSVIGTQAKASEVLAQLAATGKIGAEQFELLATAAISFEEATGQAVEKSIDAYVRLGEAPVDTLLKLNEGTNFLTESVLEQVIALQRNGEEAEAARVAQEAFADSQIERSKKIRQELGYLETAWDAVTRTAKETWDAMLNAGREETPEQEIQRLEEQLTRIAELGARRGRAQFGLGADQGNADEIRARIATLREESAASAKTAEAEGKATEERNKRLAETAAADKARTEAEKEFARIVESNLTKEQKLAAEVAKIRSTGAAARVDPAEIERQVAAAEAAFQNASSKRGRTSVAPVVRDDAATKLLLSLREQQSALELQLSTSDKLTAAEKERAEFNQQISDLKSKDILTAEQQSLLANQDAIKAQLDKNVAIEQEIKLRDDALKLQDRAAQVTASINAAQASDEEQRQRQLASFGLGSRARKQLEEQAQIRKEFQRFQEELTRDIPADLLGSDQYKSAVQEIENSLNESLAAHEKYYDDLEDAQEDWLKGAKSAFADYIDSANDLAGQTNDLIGGTLSGLEDTFVEFATTGKASFKDLADSIIADIIRIGTRLLISEALGMAGAGGGSSGNTAGLLSSIAGLFGGAGGAAAGAASYTGAFGFEGGGWTGPGERAGGVDGRGGFFAMLHPNETVVDHTRSGGAWQQSSGNPVNIGSIVLPGVSNKREAREAGAVVARQITSVVAGSARYN